MTAYPFITAHTFVRLALTHESTRAHILLLVQMCAFTHAMLGMAGLSRKRTFTTLQERILDHRASGEWTHALSCYEKAAQSRPDDLANHEGLLQCQMELGHLETVITHATGVIARHGAWEADLNGCATSQCQCVLFLRM